VIETGHYSAEADEILQLVRESIDKLSVKDTGVTQVDFYIMASRPFSLSRGRFIPDNDYLKPMLEKVFKTKNSLTVNKEVNNKNLHHEFIFMERKTLRFIRMP